jgi:hypothetical protein
VAGAAGVNNTGDCEHGVGRCWCDRWRGGYCGDIGRDEGVGF